MRLRLALLPVSCLCLAVSFPLLWGNAAAQGNPSIVGRWSLYSNLPFFPVHTHLLPTGKVAVWPGDIQAGGVSGNDMYSWDPANGATVPVSSPGYDVFCTGHVFLADGRLFVVGGHIQNGVGLPNASTYDAFNNLWTSVPPMSAGRWYPTATVLGNGDALVVSGSINNNIGENLLPSVYQVQSNTWRDLTSAQIFLGLYPRMHLAPDGRVFNSAPSVLTRSLNTSGTGGWSVIANHIVDVHRDYGSSVTYRAGRILVAGGADPPTATAEVIDLNAPIPAWRQVSSMAFPRRQHNASVLPDGKVLVTGGTSGPGFNNTGTPVFAAEMWDPDAETWTTMASAQIPRLYHSTLVLLPDGRLLSTGGNGYTQPEVYEPPYLFAGPRPTILATPTSVGHQQTFFVDTPDAAAITQVSLVSLPSVTHAFDHNQRFNRLSFTRVAGGLNVVAPSANLAPPGPYMLFILNSNGVPSVASIVRTTAAAAGVPTLTSLSPNSAAVNGPGFTLTVNGDGFVSGSVVRWNGTARPSTFVSASRLTAAIPASDLVTAGFRQIAVLNPGGASSNTLAFPVNAFTVSPATIPAGGTVTATWSGLASPAATDRIGLYVPGAANSAFLAWMYVSCSQTAGSPRASGSCPFPVPGSLPVGSYELRLVRNQTFTLLLTSNVFSVGTQPGATLSVNQTGIPSGGTLTATWGGIVAPSALDWIGLYPPGNDNRAYLAWMYVSCSQTPGSPRASGSCPFTVPSTLAPGNYELRLFANNLYDDLATSSIFSVGASPGILQLSAATYSVAENGGSATVTITRTGGAGAVGVTVATGNGTATAPADYTAVSQTVSFAAGDTANKTVSIPIVDDAAAEGNETMTVALSSPTGGATFSTPSTAVLTITDNDVAAAGTLQMSAGTYSVAENGASATITVTRTGGSAGAVGVTVATSNGTATAPADYTAVSQTVSFAAGDTANKTVTIPIVNDTAVEANETVTVALSAPTGGATVGSPGSAILTITDNDAPPPGTLQLSAATYNVAENGGSATITVTRTGGSAGAVGVTLTTSNGTATAPADYTAVSQTVSFAAGDTANKTVTIPIVNDTAVEANETVTVALSAPTGGATVGSPGSAILTITDNDAPPPGTLQLSAATYNVAENGGSATITVTRTGGSAGAVGVTLTTSNGTATAPADYAAVSQTVSFAAGDTANKTVTIPIVNDTAVEANETVTVALSAPTGGATLGTPSTAVLTITDNDAPPPGTLQLSAATYNVAENGGSATITVTRTGGSAGAVGVTVATSNGTATAPADYTAMSQTVSFAAGDTANKTVTIPIVNDTAVEANETVNVALSAPTGGATLGTPSTAVLTITDNDVAAAGTLQLSAATYSVAENGGSATITVTRTGGSAGAVGVTVATSNGTASAPADYTAVSQTVSFAAGDTTNKTVSVPITNNAVSEPSETVNLNLSAPTGGATLGTPPSAILTIFDDDSTALPALTVSPSTIVQGGSVTATWSGISNPTSLDWIALYSPVAANTAYIAWIYVSCSQTPGSAAASGSCAFVVPSTVATGTYQFRLLANNQFSVLATSNSFNVTAPAGPPLTVSPTTIARGGSVTASWSGISTPTAFDWIGLYSPGAANTAYIDWIYVSCSRTPGSPAASGWCAFVVPSTIPAGTYELRLLANDQYSVLSISNAFTVQSQEH